MARHANLQTGASIALGAKKPLTARLARDFKQNKYKYLMIIPVILYFYFFHYRAMYGIVIAFKDYRPSITISGAEWVGFKHFTAFFGDPNFWRILKNTVQISLLTLLFGFPAPILLALLINEIRHSFFKRMVQTISYMPYFISMVIVCSLIKTFTQTDGLINDIFALFGSTPTNLLADKNMFIPIYIISHIWQYIGWDSIIFIAALASIDQEQYEAAKIDGAGRIRQMWNVTLPGIMPTIIILLILRMGGILNVGFEKILLLYSPTTYSVADVISTYVYRVGIIQNNYSYTSAIGLFNSVINIAFLVATNAISRKVSESSLY